MSTATAISPAPAPPRYIQNLNAMAERLGLSVSMSVRTYDSQPANFWHPDFEPHSHQLLATWRGTRAQLLAFPGIAPSYHLPQSSGLLRVGWYRAQLLYGYVTVQGDSVTYEAQFGPVPDRIEDRAGAQIIVHAHEMQLHGERSTLIAAGMATDRQLPRDGKRRLRSCHGRWMPGSSLSIVNQAQLWHSLRHPDGSIVLTIESDAARAERISADQALVNRYSSEGTARTAAPAAARSYLRLAVDNTVRP
jgi:hypothetical protein